MKKLFFVMLFAVTVTAIFTSCESKSGKRVRDMKNITASKTTVLISQQEYDSLKNQAQQAKYLREGNESLDKFISNLKKNPYFFLLVLDAELSAIEKNEEVHGSFSDFFIPTIHEALEAGVSRIEIQKRVNKLTKLANRGLFISSYEEELFKEGGTKAIVESIGLEQ